ncbi:MAG TPA: hypothetical protein VFB60_15795 [Ktedonobacteraceae bacterium]|nr:hypothetical protein [Ktedonobacteraceae bacterium]
MASTPFGTWFFHADYGGGLNPHSFWLTVTITGQQTENQFIDGTIDANGISELLDSLSWDVATGTLEFRRVGNGFSQWYRGTVVEGVFVGRFAPLQQAGGKPDLGHFRFHVTGWNSTLLDQDIVPRSYDLMLPQDRHARLRLDRLHEGVFIGRLKVYGVGNENEHEEPEYDLEVTHWDGHLLCFILHLSESTSETYTATVVDSRHIVGTSTGQPHSGPWTGVRSGILTYGLVPKPPAAQTFWQQQTRAMLLHLMMPGNPTPQISGVDQFQAEGQTPDDHRGTHRDDSPQDHPPAYRVTELFFHTTLENPYGGPSLQREAHGFLAVPTMPAPPNGFRAVLALNGHHGGAWEMLYPQPYPALVDAGAIYWYGNAFARRGYVVLALDIEHRPQSDSQPLYNDGDPDKYLGFGSSTHPAIKPEGFSDSDWAEDGERAWDVMRALDFLLTMKDAPIDSRAILVTGLSMGGEISTIVAALDPRITGCIAAGFSPDLDVVFLRPKKNHTCWRWMHADLRDYIDTSDLHALIAPRPLIVQTGIQDHTFSSFSHPFASDKQVARRSRAAYVSEPEGFIHYLHFDGHNYHVGDPGPGNPHAGVHVPRMIAPPPGSFFDISWQTNAETNVISPTLFDLLDTFFPL